MLQRVRDEAHRFANKFHADLRSKRMKKSVLDGIEGLGPNRRERLLKHFGTTAAIKRASLEDLKAISWLPDAVAEKVFFALQPLDPMGDEIDHA